MRLMRRLRLLILAFLLTGFLASCGGGGKGGDDAYDGAIPKPDTVTDAASDARAALDTDTEPGVDMIPSVDTPSVDTKPWVDAELYAVAGGCFVLELGDGRLLSPVDGGESFGFAEAEAGAAFLLRPSDLGEYLLYDGDRHYLIAAIDGENEDSTWQIARTDDKDRISIPVLQQRSDAEWGLESSGEAVDSYILHHLNSGLYLGESGLVDKTEAAAVRLVTTEGCVDYPELSIDAIGEVRKDPWDNGDVYGVADIHSHIFVGRTYGGGGVFHGKAFHRLGVEHALGDCEETHGPGGERDVVGYMFHGDWTPDADEMLSIIGNGNVGKFVHHTDGWPTFTDWPDPRHAATHNVQYYRWLERAWMGGLRLVVELATGNSVLCSLAVGLGTQEAPLGCNDMDSVDQTIASARALERYVDAQWGGPGKGWLRIVESPAEAREVINQGKLAMVLGIEISNLYDCFLTPPPGMPECDADMVRERVEAYHAKGVRVVFPTHKYDTAFTPGDGHRGPIEIGNLINTGHYSNYVLDCPDIGGFDHGNVHFGGLNKPRDVYDAPPVLDMTNIETDLLGTLLPLLTEVTAPPLEGDYCQNGTLTPLGEVLFDELMARGVLIDVAHMPQWSIVRAFEIADEHEYPLLSTHGNSFGGQVYQHGGLTNTWLGRCGNPDAPGQMINGYLNKAAEVEAVSGLVALPLGFDFNGLAGGPGPRFGDDSGCSQPQANPITYPFTSYDGLVEFTQPMLGERVVDFNTEGMLHIGLLPEYIHDVRMDGATDDQLEPLFHTAEVFLKVWEHTWQMRTR